MVILVPALSFKTMNQPNRAHESPSQLYDNAFWQLIYQKLNDIKNIYSKTPEIRNAIHF